MVFYLVISNLIGRDTTRDSSLSEEGRASSRKENRMPVWLCTHRYVHKQAPEPHSLLLELRERVYAN